MPRILVTGSRHAAGNFHRWQITGALFEAWQELGSDRGTVLVHGDCSGVDRIAAAIWERNGMPTEAHPAEWSTGKSAGPRRNKEMVELGADRCVAFKIEGVPARGTDHCSGLAEAAGIPTTRITLANGEVA